MIERNLYRDSLPQILDPPRISLVEDFYKKWIGDKIRYGFRCVYKKIGDDDNGIGYHIYLK